MSISNFLYSNILKPIVVIVFVWAKRDLIWPALVLYHIHEVLCQTVRFYCVLFMALQVLWWMPAVIFPLKTSSCCRWRLSYGASCKACQTAVLAVNIVLERPKFRECTHTQDIFFPAWGCMCDSPQLVMRFLTINTWLSVLLKLILWELCIYFWLQPFKWMVSSGFFYVGGNPVRGLRLLRDGHMWNISTTLCHGNMAKHSEGFSLRVSFASQKRTKIAVIHRGAGGWPGTFLSSSLSFFLSLNWLFLCLKCFHWIKDAKPNPFPFSLSLTHAYNSAHTFNESLLELMLF